MFYKSTILYWLKIKHLFMKLKQNLDYENNSSVAKNIAHRNFYLNEDVPVSGCKGK